MRRPTTIAYPHLDGVCQNRPCQRGGGTIGCYTLQGSQEGSAGGVSGHRMKLQNVAEYSKELGVFWFFRGHGVR